MTTHPVIRGTDFMNQIPPELLGEIFTYSSSLNPNAPLVLGEVSRTFRRIVRITPQAWCRLRLSVYQAGMDMDTDARCIRKAEIWFAMAAILPIEVEISSLPGPSSDKARNHTHILINRHSETKEMQQELHLNTFLPQVLRNFNQRIRTLELRTTTVNEAQAFLSALYPPTSMSFVPAEMTIDAGPQAEGLPLQSLILHASSDGSWQPLHRPHSRVTTSTPPITLPNLPHLAHLKFHNHLLPHLSQSNVKNLRSLSIIYPLRFSPLSIYALHHVLGSTTRLESLEVEARVIDGFQPSSLPTTPMLTPFSPSFDQQPWSDVTTSTDSHTSVSHPSLITLPNLSHLHLRVNDLPAILSPLLLPSLHTLKINDLDGNRPGASKQMAEVVRGLLVRMELPCEGRKGKGLEVMDLCSIAVSGGGASSSASPAVHRLDDNHSPHFQGHGHGHGHAGGGIDQDSEAAEAVWSWCFRRMLTLKELHVKNLDTGALFDIITPEVTGRTTSRSASDTHAATANSMDDVALPGLRKLVVIDHDHRTYHHHQGGGVGGGHASPSGSEFAVAPSRSPPQLSSLFSFSSSLSPFTLPPTSPSLPSPSCVVAPPSISGPILKFQMRRPDVAMVYNSIPNPMGHRPSQVNVDFFDLYGH